jgi:hypothetical protein
MADDTTHGHRHKGQAPTAIPPKDQAPEPKDNQTPNPNDPPPSAWWSQWTQTLPQAMSTRMTAISNEVSQRMHQWIPRPSNSPTPPGNGSGQCHRLVVDPIWLLGRCYPAPESSSSTVHASSTETQSLTTSDSNSSNNNSYNNGNGGPPTIPSGTVQSAMEFSRSEKFASDFRSKIWMTYRYQFPVLRSTIPFNTDVGWGCMLRCGQSMLAQALVVHLLGRGTFRS